MHEKHEFCSSASLIVSVVSFITYVCLNDRVCACKVKLREIYRMCTGFCARVKLLSHVHTFPSLSLSFTFIKSAGRNIKW